MWCTRVQNPLAWYIVVLVCDCEVTVPRCSEGNPLEEKHSADGTWRDEVSKRLPKLKKLDGEQQRSSSPCATPTYPVLGQHVCSSSVAWVCHC